MILGEERVVQGVLLGLFDIVVLTMPEQTPWELAQRMCKAAKERGLWSEDVSPDTKTGSALYTKLNNCSIPPSHFVGLPRSALDRLVW